MSQQSRQQQVDYQLFALRGGVIDLPTSSGVFAQNRTIVKPRHPAALTPWGRANSQLVMSLAQVTAGTGTSARGGIYASNGTTQDAMHALAPRTRRLRSAGVGGAADRLPVEPSRERSGIIAEVATRARRERLC